MIAAWVGIATGITAIITFFISIVQRKRELRWKQAELARKLLDDVFADTDAAQGFYMLDGVKYPYKDFEDQHIVVGRKDVADTAEKQLRQEPLDDRESRILFCLDSLLYFLNRIENSLKSKLILFEDVRSPCEYYVSLIVSDKHTFSRYMESVGYVDLLRFCDRFPAWANAMKLED